MKTTRIWVLAGLLSGVAVLGQARPVTAQPIDQAKADEEARVHFRLGVAYHDSGRFADAAAEFEQAYGLSGRSKLLYNLFLAYRDGGNIPKAAAALERFLREEKEVPEREKLEARLDALKRILENRPPEERHADTTQNADEEPAKAPAEVAEAETETKPLLPEMEPNPWHKYTPWIGMGVGVALVGGGAAIGAIAKSDFDKCESSMACSSGELSSGTTKARLADGLLFGGAAVAATGVLLYFLLPREREVATTTNVACGPGMCGASLTHRF